MSFQQDNSFFDSNYTICPEHIPNHGFLFVDHGKSGLGGHLGHAMFQANDGGITAFFPVCNGDNKGHSGRGWMRYKRSYDFGRSWSDSFDFIHSKDVFMVNKNVSVMCEKAVTCNDGSIVLFALVCDVGSNALWEPYLYPYYLRSPDNGNTWNSPVAIGTERGRIYDAVYHDGVIYVLKFANSAEESWTGCRKEHVYQLFTSEDNGLSFTLRSTLPLDTFGRGYGTIEFLDSNQIIVGIYNSKDEENMDVIVSPDRGYSWGRQQAVYLAKRIRNPQLVRFGKGFLLHGRSGNEGQNPGNFVLYSSPDGFHWDEGRYLCLREAGFGEYSNNLVVYDRLLKKNRLLIQSSHAYRDNLTNIHLWWIDAK